MPSAKMSSALVHAASSHAALGGLNVRAANELLKQQDIEKAHEESRSDITDQPLRPLPRSYSDPLFASPANFRDLGDCPTDASVNIRKRAVYRCSQLFTPQGMRDLGVQAVLDLRETPRDCRKLKTKLGHAAMRPQAALGSIAYAGPSLFSDKPTSCMICSHKLSEKASKLIKVYHADLLPTMLKLKIFSMVPRRTKLHVLGDLIAGRSPRKVMAAAVANAHDIGYERLYIMMLEDGKHQVADALRVFADADNFPLLVHCIHGKDRTGIIVMLVLLLCGVSRADVIKDYVQSGISLKQYREAHHLDLDAYLIADDIIASERCFIEGALDHLKAKYHTAEEYAMAAGLTAEDIENIRRNMLQQAIPSIAVQNHV